MNDKSNGTIDVKLKPGGAKMNLVGIVPGLHWARVEKSSNPIYDYVLEIYGHCKEGYAANVMGFSDKGSGENSYKLTINSSSNGEHVVRYNSDKPTIVSLQWDLRKRWP